MSEELDKLLRTMFQAHPWHGVSAVLYVIACIAVLILVWKEDFR